MLQCCDIGFFVAIMNPVGPTLEYTKSAWNSVPPFMKPINRKRQGNREDRSSRASSSEENRERLSFCIYFYFRLLFYFFIFYFHLIGLK